MKFVHQLSPELELKFEEISLQFDHYLNDIALFRQKIRNFFFSLPDFFHVAHYQNELYRIGKEYVLFYLKNAVGDLTQLHYFLLISFFPLSSQLYKDLKDSLPPEFEKPGLSFYNELSRMIEFRYEWFENFFNTPATVVVPKNLAHLDSWFEQEDIQYYHWLFDCFSFFLTKDVFQHFLTIIALGSEGILGMPGNLIPTPLYDKIPNAKFILEIDYFSRERLNEHASFVMKPIFRSPNHYLSDKSEFYFDLYDEYLKFLNSLNWFADGPVFQWLGEILTKFPEQWEMIFQHIKDESLPYRIKKGILYSIANYRNSFEWETLLFDRIVSDNPDESYLYKLLFAFYGRGNDSESITRLMINTSMESQQFEGLLLRMLFHCDKFFSPHRSDYYREWNENVYTRVIQYYMSFPERFQELIRLAQHWGANISITNVVTDLEEMLKQSLSGDTGIIFYSDIEEHSEVEQSFLKVLPWYQRWWISGKQKLEHIIRSFFKKDHSIND